MHLVDKYAPFSELAQSAYLQKQSTSSMCSRHQVRSYILLGINVTGIWVYKINNYKISLFTRIKFLFYNT